MKYGSLIILAIIVITVIVVTNIFFKTIFNFKYIYSKDKKYVLTRVERATFFSKYIYLTPGYYKNKAIPPIFISPKLEGDGLDKGYYSMIIHWKGDTYIVYNGLAYCTRQNLNSKFHLVDINEVNNFDWMRMKSDTTEEYIYLFE